MATWLYRLGRLTYRRRTTVTGLWLLLVVALSCGAAALSAPTSNSFALPGTESQRAFDLLEEQFPGMNAAGATARVVFAAPDGATLTDPDLAAAVAATVADLADGPQVQTATDPFASRAVAPDGSVAFSQVQFTVDAPSLTEQARAALLNAAAAGEDTGLRVEVGGDALQATPEQHATEAVGVAVAALVLLLTFGSLVAAGLPLVTALVGVGLGVAGITATTGFVELSSTTPVLALMLGLAVGIDYALFIVSRYRHELAVGYTGEDAAGRAVGTAGSAVVFAGATVVIALSALSVVGIPFLTAMGLAAAGTVAVAVVVALTLLPALLGFAGRRVLPRKHRDVTALDAGDDPESGHTAGGRDGLAARWGRFVVRHRVPVVVVTVLGLGLMAVPAADLRLGLPTDETAAADTTQRQAYDLLADGFGPGVNGTLLLVVDGAGAAQAAGTVAADLAETAGVVAVTPPQPNPDGDTAVLTVVPATGPSDAATGHLVETIRGQAYRWADDLGVAVLVSGQTAIMIDISNTLADALVPYLAVILGLSLLLLMLVFRSVWVPVKAAAGFGLTIAATLGAVVAVFQWGWLTDLLGFGAQAPVMSMLPIFMVGVVFGLAMDYELFIVTRIREDFVHGASPDDAVVGGLSHGGRVVSAAALIMVAVFSGFVFSGDDMVTAMGFGLAVGVAVDAFVVRMTLVPAVMSLLGGSAWWLPGWLDRALPNVDVEGEQLNQSNGPG